VPVLGLRCEENQLLGGYSAIRSGPRGFPDLPQHRSFTAELGAAVVISVSTNCTMFLYVVEPSPSLNLPPTFIRAGACGESQPRSSRNGRSYRCNGDHASQSPPHHRELYAHSGRDGGDRSRCRLARSVSRAGAHGGPERYVLRTNPGWRYGRGRDVPVKCAEAPVYPRGVDSSAEFF
jgi:hypothetical protein